MIALGPKAFRVKPIGGAGQVPAAARDALARRGFHLHRRLEAAERGFG